MKPRCPDETGTIRSLALKHPREAFRSQEQVSREWRPLGYTAEPDFEKALDEYDAFAAILEAHIEEVSYLPADESTGMDSLYIRDALVVTSVGGVLARMGKEARGGEPGSASSYLEERGLPLLGAVTGTGLLEGGDVVQLDPDTLLVGEGYRTNREGIARLAELVKPGCVEVITVPLPHDSGPGDVLHLMSFLSPVDHRTLLVYSPMVPVYLRNLFLERGYRLVEVPSSEYPTMACNVLALSPGRALMLEGNPVTRMRLERAGIEVLTYRGEEISRKGAGGPTCLTRPLVRKE